VSYKRIKAETLGILCKDLRISGGLPQYAAVGVCIGPKIYIYIYNFVLKTATWEVT
jgi:hypothetical protein